MELTPLQQVEQRIHNLREAMEKQDPRLRTHISEIHKHLTQYEELTHLLPDDAIILLVSAQKQATGTVLAEKVAKQSKASDKKMLKDLSDL